MLRRGESGEERERGEKESENMERQATGSLFAHYKMGRRGRGEEEGDKGGEGKLRRNKERQATGSLLTHHKAARFVI